MNTRTLFSLLPGFTASCTLVVFLFSLFPFSVVAQDRTDSISSHYYVLPDSAKKVHFFLLKDSAQFKEEMERPIREMAMRYAHVDSDSTVLDTLIMEIDTEHFDWNPVMDAIIEIESRGNAQARNGIYVGAMQISPMLVKECNNILKRRGSSNRFSLSDRWSVTKSKEMFVVMMSQFNPENDVDKAFRIWKGGPYHRRASTQKYVNRARAIMQRNIESGKYD